MTVQNKLCIKLATLITICSLLKIHAQQTPSFAEYNYNPLLINAAYTGSSPSLEIAVGSAGYFSPFDGSPRNYSFTGHKALGNDKMGIGAGVMRDEIGVQRSTNLFAAYSYKIYFGNDRPLNNFYESNVLSFGVTAGVQQFQDNLSALGIIDDEVFAEDITATVPALGLGFLYNRSKYYVGLSSPNVLGDALLSNKDISVTQVFYGYAGYRLFVGRDKTTTIKPNLLMKYEIGAPYQIDLNCAVSFKNNFELGAGYRTSNAFNVLAGVYLFDSIRAVYNYTIGTGNTPLGNTHGFILTYQSGSGFKIN